MSIWIIDDGRKVNILGLMLIYASEVDKVEYPDFECWKSDMLKTGIIKKEV